MAFYNVFLQLQDNGCYIPTIPHGYNEMIHPSKVDEIIKGLKNYKNNFTDSEIDEYNIKRIVELNNGMKSLTDSKEDINKKTKGYVYLLSCADKYKIGYSNNVERRMKELDTRPFSLELVCKTYSDIAFDVEQRIHKIMSKYNVEGEWYDFNFEVKADEFSDFVLKVERKILLERGQI